MANISRVRGFLPLRHLTGAPYNGQGQVAFLNSSVESGNVFIGDMVQWANSSGTLGQTVSGMDVEGMPCIIHSTLTTTLASYAGVVIGFIQDQTLPLKYYNATANRIALIEQAPDVVFEVQEDGNGGNIAAGGINMNVQAVTAAGSTVTGLSAYTIASTSTATTSTLPWHILGLVKRPDNHFGLSSTDLAKFEVYRVFTQEVGV